MRKYLRTTLLGLLACALFPMAGCYQEIASELYFGSTKTNAQVLAVAQKIDNANAIVASDLPGLCSIASNFATTLSAVGSISNDAKLTTATATVAAATTSPICTQGLTGTIADAQTLAASIKAMAAVTKGTVTAAVTPASSLPATSVPTATPAGLFAP